MATLMTNIWFLIALLIVGFILLILGADWLVAGASGLAKRFKVSDLVIGLTVVAFGTSMPEFVVNMISVADGATDLAITNILGSNIINTFVILGVTALIYPIVSQKRSRDFDIPMSIIAGLLVFVFTTYSFDKTDTGITHWGGIMLLAFFILFLFFTFRHAKDHPNETETETYAEIKLSKALLLIVAGLAGLILGGQAIVESAVTLANQMGVSESIIGLTIVALGTSLPELATSAMAAYRRNSDIALGNVVGSNIFNVFFILGTSAVIKPLPSYVGLEIDALMAMMGGVVVWLLIKSSRKRRLTRLGGVVLLLGYAVYLTYRLIIV